MPVPDALADILAQSPSSPQALGRATLLLLLLTLGAVILVTGLVALALLRRGRRLLGKPPRAVPTPVTDAWAEAGRRVEAPTAKELERGADGGAEPVPDRAFEPYHGMGRPVALVTGGARRVGRAIALALARGGCDVIFTYNRSADEAQSLARELSRAGSEASFYQLDLADGPAVEQFAATLAETLPRLDVVVHNASIYGPSPLDELTAEDAMNHYRVNALSPLVLTARLAPLLARSTIPGGGAVVAVADIHAMGRPRRDHAAYSMSKAAVAEMVRSLARDLAPRVRVNGIAPGVIAWPESGEESTPEAQAKYIRRIPLGRAGTPEDAGEVVRWLALEATYLTGEVVRVDGGRWLT